MSISLFDYKKISDVIHLTNISNPFFIRKTTSNYDKFKY